jgi:hypothetical protein
VDTGLNKEGRGGRHIGIPPSEVAKATLEGLKSDQFEIAVGMAQGLVAGSRQNPEEAFNRINQGR